MAGAAGEHDLTQALHGALFDTGQAFQFVGQAYPFIICCAEIIVTQQVNTLHRPEVLSDKICHGGDIFHTVSVSGHYRHADPERDSRVAQPNGILQDLHIGETGELPVLLFVDNFQIVEHQVRLPGYGLEYLRAGASGGIDADMDPPGLEQRYCRQQEAVLQQAFPA